MTITAPAPTSFVMKVSRNGQVSLPAAVRHRWASDRVLVLDLHDRVVVRPLPVDPADDVTQLRGKYRGAPSTDGLRAAARAEDRDHEDRHLVAPPA